jgi:hypothetical protein
VMQFIPPNTDNVGIVKSSEYMAFA